MKNSLSYLEQFPEVNEEFLALAHKETTADGKEIMVSTGPHILKLVRDEIGERTNPKTKVKEKVIWYHFEDPKTGDLYKYAVRIYNQKRELSYLIRKLGGLPEGTIVQLEFKKNPNTYKGFVDVKVVALPEPAGSQPSKNEEEEEPVIEKEKCQLETLLLQMKTPTTISLGEIYH